MKRSIFAAAPGTDYDILGKLLPGVIVSVTGKNDVGTWWQVSNSGVAGWVSAELVNTQGDTAQVQAQQVASPAPTGTPQPGPLRAGEGRLRLRQRAQWSRPFV